MKRRERPGGRAALVPVTAHLASAEQPLGARVHGPFYPARPVHAITQATHCARTDRHSISECWGAIYSRHS